ncbi:Zinc finger protein [Ceratobasidium sp. AG-Ba]|nr:Zinc finger protein [Ceratobasidium sp. AG-Ba]
MSRAQLRTMPLSHLKAYMSAYGLAAPPHAVEKDEYVRAALSAREANGCLPKANEEYYRKNSIPQPSGERPRGFLARLADNFADLVDLLPQPDAANPNPPPVPPRPNLSRGAPRNPRSQWPPPPPPRAQSGPGFNATNARSSRPQAPPRPQAQAPPQTQSPRPTPQPVPVDQLLEMTPEQVSKLSIGVLKAILQQNHVRIPQDALEKRDLVERVVTLVDAARAEKERDARVRAAEQAEEQAEIEAQLRAFEELEKARTDEQKTEGPRPTDEKLANGESEPHSNLPKASRPVAAKLERDGLCVICQDEDANIAIVDCGML